MANDWIYTIILRLRCEYIFPRANQVLFKSTIILKMLQGNAKKETSLLYHLTVTVYKLDGIEARTREYYNNSILWVV
jgi:hypothetical protein